MDCPWCSGTGLISRGPSAKGLESCPVCHGTGVELIVPPCGPGPERDARIRNLIGWLRKYHRHTPGILQVADDIAALLDEHVAKEGDTR